MLSQFYIIGGISIGEARALWPLPPLATPTDRQNKGKNMMQCSVVNSVTVVTATRYKHVTMVQSDNLSRKQSCRVAVSIERNSTFNRLRNF